MHKGLIAENILSLTTPRERAVSIAGDLVEESAGRGLAWFCTTLAGVAMALFFAAFGAARKQTVWLLARGLVVWSLVYAGVRIAGALAGIQPLVTDDGSFESLAPALQLYLAATLMLSSVLTGILLGGAATANGLNAVMPLAVFWALAAILAPLMDLVAGTATWYCTVLYLLGLPLCYLMPLLAGGALAGRRAAPLVAKVPG